MIPPNDCPYSGRTAPPCWSCTHHIADIDQCALACIVSQTAEHTGLNANAAQTYEERLRDYEKRRQELLQLSKEALVDLILHRPTMY